MQCSCGGAQILKAVCRH
ncbi:MAG: hypothetical protein ACLQO7_12355 [Candidatus Bathyarchaeia archaeon]